MLYVKITTPDKQVFVITKKKFQNTFPDIEFYRVKYEYFEADSIEDAQLKAEQIS